MNTNTTLAGLSSRETQILQLLMQGLAIKNIAEQLLLSSKTVCSYKIRILEKTETKNDIELVLWAIRHKLIPIN